MKHLIKFTIAIIIMACCNKSVLAAYGTYEQQAEDEMNCAKKNDGFYPNTVNTNKFVLCAAGVTHHFNCTAGQVFDMSCKCCNWPLETIPEYMKKCNTMSSVGLCDCRDNSDLAKRGPGSCSCNANGVGINYSRCSDTWPPCPEIKDIDGVSYPTAHDVKTETGKCYIVPKTGVSLKDTVGIFEFVSGPPLPPGAGCYYSE